MIPPRKYAEIAAASLAKMLKAGTDSGKVADIVESVLAEATREHEEQERQHLAEVEAAAEVKLARLLDASPAVIYSFKARDDFAPLFVSQNIMRLFGYAAREYLEDPNFWRERVHPEDLARVEAEIGDLFQEGKHAIEYRFRRKDGTYSWVNDEQHLVRNAKGEPVEIVGSWSDISARKAAEETEDRARERLALLLETVPSVIYSFEATGDYAPTFVSENIKRLLGYCPDEYLKNADFWRARASIPTTSRAWRLNRRSFSRRPAKGSDHRTLIPTPSKMSCSGVNHAGEIASRHVPWRFGGTSSLAGSRRALSRSASFKDSGLRCLRKRSVNASSARASRVLPLSRASKKRACQISDLNSTSLRLVSLLRAGRNMLQS